MTSHESILIIDDEIQIRRLLRISLTASGYHTVEASTGHEGILLAASHNPDLILLDLGLPDMDGKEVLKKLRDWYLQPILILSVRNAEEEIIRSLDSGASDYLIKPFRTGELMARIRVALRRTISEQNQPILEFGSLTLDIGQHLVTKNGKPLHLTSKEFSLLTLFAIHAGRVLTHQFILNKIWGPGSVEQTQILRVFVAQLRKKIEDDPTRPQLFITEQAIGYRFGT